VKKYLLSIILITFAQTSLGEILEVYTWKPYPGKAEQLQQTFEEAAEIHSSLGIGVTINALGVGTSQNIDYVLRYDDLESYGRLKDANFSDANWNTFLAKARANPSGELVDSWSANNLDSSNMADDFTEQGQVIAFFRWQPAPGAAGLQAMTQAAMRSKPIHEDLGSHVEVYQINSGEYRGQVLYLMIYDSFSDMAETNAAMASSSEWQSLLLENSTNPNSGTLVLNGQAMTIGSWN
jgi:hypothetical protein